MEIEKLKSCPFCGGEASLTIPSEHVQADCADIYVSCDECEAEGQHFVVEMQDRTPDLWPYEQRDAIAAWNTRAPAEQTGWRDIETAPKDRTEFLALVSNGWHALVSAPADGLRNEWPYLWWRSSDRHSYPVVQTFPADTDWDATSTLRLTHWQPLPAPPGTTRAPADLRSALEVETIERCAEIADSHVALGYMSGRERDYCHQHGDEIAEKIRALAPTKGDRS